MAKDRIAFSTRQQGMWIPYEEHIIPDDLRAGKLFRGDIKIYSRKGGSDGELSLMRFMDSMSTYTQEYFLEYKEAVENKQAYVHVKYEVEGARAELK